MDTNQYYDDELRQLFGQLPVEKLSAGFSSRVMSQVLLEAQHAAQQRRMLRTILSIVIPCGVAILLAATYFALGYWKISPLEYFKPVLIPIGNSFSAIARLFAETKGGQLILFGVMVLSLLLGDLFIRRSIVRKKNLVTMAQ